MSSSGHHFTSVVLETCFHFFVHFSPLFLSKLIAVHCSCVNGGRQSFFGVIDVSTNSFFVPCSSRLNVRTSSPPDTEVRFTKKNFLLKLGGTIWCTSFNCANSHMVTDALAVSTAMNSFRASASTCLLLSHQLFHDHSLLVSWHQVRDKLPSTDQSVILSNWCSVCWENHQLVRCVANLQGDRTIRLPPVIRLPASSTPPTTHAVLLSSFTVFSTHLHHRKSSTGKTLHHYTDMSECDGSSSFRSTNHVSKEFCAPSHDTNYDISCFVIFRNLAPISADYFFGPLRQIFVFQPLFLTCLQTGIRRYFRNLMVHFKECHLPSQQNMNIFF